MRWRMVYLFASLFSFILIFYRCWMCRGDWKSHGQHTGGFYSCNKYEASDAKKVDDEATRLKSESDRFLHYFNRYFNHDVLNKVFSFFRLTVDRDIYGTFQQHAEKQKREIQQKMDQFREHTNQNPDFMMEAVDLLIECRRILKYTYPADSVLLVPFL